MSYKIVTLTENTLVLEYNHSTAGLYTISFTNPAAKSLVEGLLTAHDWVLASVTRDNASVTPDVSGNKMTLNADHSFSFDCSANGGYTANYTDGGSVTVPNFSYSWATYEWSVSIGSDSYLAFTEMSYPLVIVDEYYNYALSYKIATLNDSTLVLEYNHSTDGLYRITFNAIP